MYEARDFRALKISTPNGAILTGSEVDDLNDALEAAAHEVEWHAVTRKRLADALYAATDGGRHEPTGGFSARAVEILRG